MSFKKVAYFIFCGVLVIIFLKIVTSLKDEQWTLFVYADGRDNSATSVLPGFETQRFCVEKGLQLMSLPENSKNEAIFTCGLNCNTDEFGTVCQKICYKDGTCRE